MNKKKLKRFELKINPEKLDTFFNSLVESPAIETNFIAFESEDNKKIYFANEEERKITGPLMIANKDILRKDKDGEYYMVYFTKESIDDIVKLFAKNNRFNAVKEDHNNEIDGLYLIESWIVGSEDKIYSDFNFSKEEVPEGSWVGTYYIEDNELWEKVKNGTFNGFSVEGYFDMNEEKFVIEPNPDETKNEFLQRCISKESKDYPQEQAVAICYSKWENKGFKQFEDSYNDYPQAATDNAMRALKWVEENGWGECGTQVGKIKAYQLANRERISMDTIARMSSFARHLQWEDKEYGDGCGKLILDAWGGREGIEWANKKLDEIRNNEFQSKEEINDEKLMEELEQIKNMDITDEAKYELIKKLIE